MTEKRRPVVDPLVVQVIENNILLKQATSQLTDIAQKQDANHVVTLALKEHKTIERVDSLWTDLGQIKFLLRVTAGGVLFAVALVPFFAFMHAVWHWPA